MNDPLIEGLMRELGIATEEEFWRKTDYAPALAWLERYKDALAREHPSQYLLLNVQDLSHVVAADYDSAQKQYSELYKSTPRLGRDFIGQRL
jgi:hypothetical protein